VLDSFRLTAAIRSRHRQLARADDVIIVTSVSDEDAKEKFPRDSGVKPYLRFTPSPSLSRRPARRPSAFADRPVAPGARHRRTLW